MAESKNLIEGLQEEMDRVQEMVTEYRSVPRGAGILAAKFMEVDIAKAKTAISTEDTIQMITSLKILKEYKH